MKAIGFFFLLAPGLFAHMMSMSSGDLTVVGNRAHYELRMPIYEMAHIQQPERSILEHITFRSAGEDGRLARHECHPDQGDGVYVCAADYEFPSPVEVLEVECSFHSITVPNHVHLLRAERDDKRDQALFDYSFPKATLRFAPPSAVEEAAAQIGAGFGRAFGGLVQVLFLAGLVLASRSRRELFALAGMFLAGQVAAAVLVPVTGWQPAARFVEAAAALTIAYLAVEILTLPQAGYRWLIAGILGGFHGLYFELFLRTTDYHAAYVLTGAALGEGIILTVLALAFSRLARIIAALRPVQVSASILLVVGMTWFFLRLRG